MIPERFPSQFRWSNLALSSHFSKFFAEILRISRVCYIFVLKFEAIPNKDYSVGNFLMARLRVIFCSIARAIIILTPSIPLDSHSYTPTAKYRIAVQIRLGIAFKFCLWCRTPILWNIRMPDELGIAFKFCNFVVLNTHRSPDLLPNCVGNCFQIFVILWCRTPRCSQISD